MRRFLFLLFFLSFFHNNLFADGFSIDLEGHFGPCAHVNFGKTKVTLSVGIELGFTVNGRFINSGFGADYGLETNGKGLTNYIVFRFARLVETKNIEMYGLTFGGVKQKDKKWGIQSSVWCTFTTLNPIMFGSDFRFRRIEGQNEYGPGANMTFY